VVPPLLAAYAAHSIYQRLQAMQLTMPLAIGSPANTGAVAQTTESGIMYLT
jgi:hypothetical protein